MTSLNSNDINCAANQLHEHIHISSRFIPILPRLVVEQMCDDDCCVIDDLLFPHPPHTGLLYEHIDRLAWSHCCFGDFNRLLVVNKLPKTVRGHNDELVRVGIKNALREFGVRDDTGGMRDSIPKRSVQKAKARASELSEPRKLIW